MLTKKQFIAIASAMRATDAEVAVVNATADVLVEHSGNPHFDRDRFVEAATSPRAAQLDADRAEFGNDSMRDRIESGFEALEAERAAALANGTGEDAHLEAAYEDQHEG